MEERINGEKSEKGLTPFVKSCLEAISKNPRTPGNVQERLAEVYLEAIAISSDRLSNLNLTEAVGVLSGFTEHPSIKFVTRPLLARTIQGTWIIKNAPSYKDELDRCVLDFLQSGQDISNFGLPTDLEILLPLE